MNSLIGQAKPIVQLDQYGNRLRVFPSVKAAGESTGVNRTSISQCLVGKMKSAGGFKWIYLRETDQKPNLNKYCQSCRKDTPPEEQVIICLDCFRK